MHKYVTCQATPFICVKISEHGEQRLHTLEMQDKSLKPKKKIYTYLLKACRKLVIQTVTEHCTASTDHQFEFLNGFVTVQHCSFRKQK